MLKAGQVLYDNDPRYRGRKVEVVRIEDSYAVCLSVRATPSEGPARLQL